MSSSAARYSFEGVHFLPWVGKDYEAGGGVVGLRLLFVGESHYDWEDDGRKTQDRETLTRDIVEEIAGGKRHAFWTRARRLVSRRCGDPPLNAFWSSVAVYEFVQRRLVKGHRPTEEMCRRRGPSTLSP